MYSPYCIGDYFHVKKFKNLKIYAFCVHLNSQGTIFLYIFFVCFDSLIGRKVSINMNSAKREYFHIMNITNYTVHSQPML